MTSTQEPNTIAPQSALCICSRKWTEKLIVPIYFGTKTSDKCVWTHDCGNTSTDCKARILNDLHTEEIAQDIADKIKDITGEG